MRCIRTKWHWCRGCCYYGGANAVSQQKQNIHSMMMMSRRTFFSFLSIYAPGLPLPSSEISIRWDREKILVPFLRFGRILAHTQSISIDSILLFCIFSISMPNGNETDWIDTTASVTECSGSGRLGDGGEAEEIDFLCKSIWMCSLEECFGSIKAYARQFETVFDWFRMICWRLNNFVTVFRPIPAFGVCNCSAIDLHWHWTVAVCLQMFLQNHQCLRL